VLSHSRVVDSRCSFKLTRAWIVPFSFVSLFKVSPTGGCDAKKFRMSVFNQFVLVLLGLFPIFLTASELAAQSSNQ